MKCRHCHGQFFVPSPHNGSVGRRSLGGSRGGRSASPTVLLVEHRDEVFARVAADLGESGYTVVRATTASEALGLYARTKHTFVLANLSLPDQSGWLLAGKLHFISGDVRIWLYESEKTATDVAMAKFLRVDELLEYGGDLLGLSDAILDLLAGRQKARSRRYLTGAKPATARAAA